MKKFFRKGSAYHRHSIYLDTDLSKKLQVFCAAEEKELSEIVAEAVQQYLNYESPTPELLTEPSPIPIFNAVKKKSKKK